MESSTSTASGSTPKLSGRRSPRPLPSTAKARKLWRNGKKSETVYKKRTCDYCSSTDLEESTTPAAPPTPSLSEWWPSWHSTGLFCSESPTASTAGMSVNPFPIFPHLQLILQRWQECSTLRNSCRRKSLNNRVDGGACWTFRDKKERRPGCWAIIAGSTTDRHQTALPMYSIIKP